MQYSLINRFKEKINQSNSIVIVPHHNPDGDAMGSCLGLNEVLKKIGKQSNVITPSGYPSFLNWMVGSDEVINFESHSKKAIELLDVCDLMIMVDFNCTKRVKSFASQLEAFQGYKVIIDHHPFPDESSADLIISDINVSSTCELMVEVLTQSNLKEEINKEAASCFYTGIMTDTGSLSHNSSRPETYHIVAELVGIGIDKDEIHRLVFHSNSLNRMRLLGYSLLDKMKIIPELGAAYISLSEQELLQFNFQPGDTEGLVNYPLGIEGISVSALFMEQNERIKVSLRSQGDVAVNQLSEENFNGGGHFNAAGGESTLSMDETIKMYINALPKFIGNN